MPNELLNLVWAQLWQVTVVALLIGLISFLLKARKWHPAAANWLWLLVLAKALTPPLWASPFGIFSWTDTQVISRATTVDSSATLGLVGGSGLVAAAILFAWSLGFLFVLVGHISRWRKLRSLIDENQVAVDRDLPLQIERLAEKLGLQVAPPVVVTEVELGPALVGIWRPSIVLPQSLVSTVSWSEIEPIVAHELLHLRRRDTAISALQLLANAIWWFHPLVRWAGKQVEEASERCVDLAVLHVAGCDARTYCRSLLRVLEMRSADEQCLMLAAPGVRGVSATYERISELAEVAERPSFWQRSTRLALVGFLGLVLLPGRPLDVLRPRCCSSNWISAEQLHQQREVRLFDDHRSQLSPASQM
ncbi:MAG: M56 family metallopeptidase [Planctomycetota bacterium]